MSRKRRLNISGYWYHICIRGQRKQPLFFSHEDRKKYIALLDKGVYKYDGKIGAFVLMTNHIHIVLQMGKYPFGKIFHNVNTKYALYFNTLRKTVGHVFQNRPVIKIILNEKYLGTVIKYIYDNPVKANICDSPNKYRWSSLQIRNNYFEEIKLKSWKTINNIYENVKVENSELYIGNKDEYIDLEKRVNNNNIIPNRRKNNELKSLIFDAVKKTPYTIKELSSKIHKKEFAISRKNIMVEMYKKGFSPKEIASFFNRTPKVVFNAVKEFKKNFD